MKPHRLFLVALLACLLCPPAEGQPIGRLTGQAKILFLHLKMSQGIVHSLGSSVRQGTVKVPRVVTGSPGIGIVAISSNGDRIFKGSIGDPSIRRYEYEDPHNPAHLISRQVALDDVEFTVRVPYSTDLSRVEFYREVEPQAGSPLLKPSSLLIGTVSVDDGRRDR